jgi:hypothetical protein
MVGDVGDVGVGDDSVGAADGGAEDGPEVVVGVRVVLGAVQGGSAAKRWCSELVRGWNGQGCKLVL